MAKEKKESTIKEKLEKGEAAGRAYLAKIKDRNYKAIKDANEAIDYDFEKLSEKETQDKYTDSLYNSVKEHIEKELGTKLKDDRLADSIIKALGGVTKNEIERIVKGREKLSHEELARILDERHGEFAREHYGTIAAEHIKEKEDAEEAIKHFGLEDKVDIKSVTPVHAHNLFTAKGITGEISERNIPYEIKKTREKYKKAA